MRRYLNESELILNKNNLTKKSLNSGMQSLIGQVASFVIMMGSTAVLARLLNPADYGLIAIVIAMTTFFNLFKDFGLSVTLIQRQTIKNDEVSTIYWFTVFIGFILTCLFMLLSYPVSDFYNNNRLINIMFVVSSVFIIGSFSIIPNAILRRNMQFKKLMYIQIFSSFLSAVIAIYLAYKGYGYWVLVLNLVLPVFMTSIATIYVLNWFPKISYSGYYMYSYIKVGKYILSFDIVNYFSRNLDNILIGKFYTTADLGFYSKAYQLLLLPIQQIRIPLVNVALPALSSVRNDAKMFNFYYLALCDILNILIIPIVCLMWLNAYEIIYIILGEKWLYSSEIFKLLALAALVQPLLGTFGLVLISLNKNKKYFYWGILNFTIIITSFIIGVNYNLKTFIIIYVIANYISFIISIPYVLKISPISIFNFVKSFFVPIIYFVPLTYIISIFFNNESLKIHDLIVKTIIFILFYGLFFIILPNYRKKVLNMKQIFKKKDNNVS